MKRGLTGATAAARPKLLAISVSDNPEQNQTRSLSMGSVDPRPCTINP